MPANKTWVGGTSGAAGDLSEPDNWKAITIRSAGYKWTLSGSGTSEYYLEASGGGDPSLEDPDNVQEDGTNMTEGTAGALTAGQWDWGDNDTLGFNTVYVRLTDSVDPDTKAANYVTYTAIPKAGDHVSVPASSSQAITDGLDSLSALALGDFIVHDGYSNDMADENNFLRINPSYFKFSGSGAAYIDLTSAAVSPLVTKTATPSTGNRGLYLIGTAITTLICEGGYVGLAWRNGETATAATVRISGAASVWIGEGATVTTVYQSGGSAVIRAALTTLTVYGGTAQTEGDQTVTTVNVYGGTVTANSSGTITTANADGGELDLTDTTITRTVTNLKLNPDSTLKWDKNTVTVTNWTTPDHPCEYETSEV